MPILSMKCKECNEEQEYLIPYEEKICKNCGSKKLKRMMGKVSKITLTDNKFTTPVDLDSKNRGTTVRFTEYGDKNSNRKWIGTADVSL